MYDGDVATFTFNEPIDSYFVAIRGYQLAFSGHDHHVKDIEVSMAPSKISETQVQVRASLNLDDSSGNSGYRDYTWAFVTVVALGKQSSSAGNLEQITSLCAGPASTQMSSTVEAAASALGSFKYAFSKDHHVQKTSASVSSKASDQIVTTQGSVMMEDKSDNSADCKKLEAGLIATFLNQPGFEIRFADFNLGSTNYGKDNNKTTVTFEHDVRDAVALLASYKMSYGSKDHHLKGIKAGNMKYDSGNNSYSTSGAIEINGKDVTVINNETMHDNSSHQSNDNQATFLVIAATDSDTGELKDLGGLRASTIE